MPSLRAPVSESEGEGDIQDEELYLPSHYSRSERAKMQLSQLSSEELELRQIQVVECIMQLRHTTKKLSIARAEQKKDLPGQYTGTRATGIRNAIEFNQECLLLIYNAGRQAMVTLSDDESIGEAYPSLTLADCYRKATTHKREKGDSRRIDGKLWKTGARAETGTDPAPGPEEEGEGEEADDGNDGTEKEKGGEADGSDGGSRGGKLWSPKIGLTVDEVEEWDREGKRFNAEVPDLTL